MLPLTSAFLIATAAINLGRPTPLSGPAVPTVQQIRVHLSQRTVVYGKLLIGDYVIVHDEGAEAREKPCTTFYRVEASGERPVVAFHCVKRTRVRAAQPTLVVRPKASPLTASGLTTAVELLEYQFAGDTEAHGVPGM